MTTIDRISHVALIAVCALLSVLVGLRLWNERRPANNPSAPIPVQDIANKNWSLRLSDNPEEGKRTAKLILEEFSDFQCPFCGRHTREVYPAIRREYIEPGRVRHIFRNLPLPGHRFALAAAQAAECARHQNRYWQMHSVLFANQAALNGQDFDRLGVLAGVEPAPFSACLQRDPPDTITVDREDAGRFEINATPTFLIGVVQGEQVKLLMRINGAQPYEVFKNALDAAEKSVSPRT